MDHGGRQKLVDAVVGGVDHPGGEITPDLPLESVLKEGREKGIKPGWIRHDQADAVASWSGSGPLYRRFDWMHTDSPSCETVDSVRTVGRLKAESWDGGE
jgi:hypothetical protein